MIHIKDACLTFKNQTIFNDITCTIQPDARIGLVGLNGSGKSTLLRVIAGTQKLDSGVIQKPSSFIIGYMPQECTLVSTKNILDETMSAATLHDETDEQHMIVEAKKILQGLGFNSAQFDQPVAQLSTGWKMRVVLAQLLLQKADFYLFDEPTNHMDLLAQEWFFNFLAKAPFGFVLVSHDRYFLDNICTTIFELEQGTLTKYNGNYTTYLAQKAARTAIRQATYDNQQREIARKTRTIERFRAKATKARMVKKMERDIEKMDKITISSIPATVHFSFLPTKEAGKVVLTVQHLTFSFAKKPILKNVSFTILRDERVAIVAPNGTGKSTLLNLLTGKLKSQSGTILFGHNVKVAYFEQDQLETFDPEKTIFETVQSRTNVPDQTIRTILGSFLFSGDFINKKIKVLSGGERNRVNMVCTLLQQANFLMLDEPTNHLDIYSKEILLQAIKAYQGTVLFVSHDHNFVNELATSILELNNYTIAHYHGNYESYLEQKKLLAQPQATAAKTPEQKTEKLVHIVKDKNALKILEHTISKLEKKVAQLSERLAHLAYDDKDFAQVCAQLQTTQKELEEQVKEWEKLVSSPGSD